MTKGKQLYVDISMHIDEITPADKEMIVRTILCSFLGDTLHPKNKYLADYFVYAGNVIELHRKIAKPGVSP